MQSPPPNPESTRDIMRAVLRNEAAAVSRLAGSLPPGSLEAVERLLGCQGHVIVTGMGKMSAVARKFAATLCSTGTPATFLHPSEALHGDLGVVTGDQLLVALSNSGETEDVVALVPYMKRYQVPVIAITGSPRNALADNSDCVISLDFQSEADPVTDAPTCSTTATLAMCDALAIALVHRRGFTREQFALVHPAGQLGKQLLLTVGDLMQRGQRLPLVDGDASLREAIVVISAMGLGTGLVCDPHRKLLGILTDGDLRRLLEKHRNPLELPVHELMNANPLAIEAGRLAVEALNLMRQRSITALPVTEGATLTGLIHLHDLLRAGMGHP